MVSTATPWTGAEGRAACQCRQAYRNLSWTACVLCCTSAALFFCHMAYTLFNSADCGLPYQGLSRLWWEEHTHYCNCKSVSRTRLHCVSSRALKPWLTNIHRICIHSSLFLVGSTCCMSVSMPASGCPSSLSTDHVTKAWSIWAPEPWLDLGTYQQPLHIYSIWTDTSIVCPVIRSILQNKVGHVHA